MSLSAADIQEIMRLIEASGFDELILENAGIKLVLRRGAAAAVSAPAAVAPTAVASTAPAAAPAAAPVAQVAVEAAAGTPIESPMLGTFYRAPKPGAPPFVEVGVAVEADTVIGIVEVMKLMNTVRAGVRGTVVAVVAQDGALVEYGETLIRVAVAE